MSNDSSTSTSLVTEPPPCCGGRTSNPSIVSSPPWLSPILAPVSHDRKENVMMTSRILELVQDLQDDTERLALVDFHDWLDETDPSNGEILQVLGHVCAAAENLSRIVDVVHTKGRLS